MFHSFNYNISPRISCDKSKRNLPNSDWSTFSTMGDQQRNICYAKGSEEPVPSQPGALRLYNMPFCPFAYRVRMVLAAKGVPYEEVNIDLGSKPEWFLTKNPEGIVPALELDGHLITESLVLSDFIDAAYGSERGSLWSQNPLQKAKEKLLIDRAAKLGDINGKVYRRKDYSAFDEFLDELTFFEKHLNARRSQYFSGRPQPGMVDYMIWAFFKTALLLWSLGLYQGQRALLSTSERPFLTDWMRRMDVDRICRDVHPDDETSARFWSSLVDGRPQFHLGLNRMPPVK